ncbi:MAG TPA: AMP-binding protein, partial [Pseudonocardia sp.]|nr:AMP-binding protein [Pseudonocardia sp.]
MHLPDLRSAVDAAAELVRPSFASVAGTVLAVGVLTRSGVVRPVRPDRLLGMVGGMLRYGFTVTSGYAAGAARHPDRTAILDDAGRLTFGEVHARTDRLAAALADTGIGAGSRVGILCRNSRSPVEAQVALGKLGADAVLLNTGLSPDRLAAVARELALHTVIADAEFTDLLSGLPAACGRITAWGAGPVSLEELIEHGGDTPLPLRPPPGRTIVLTSGTTGTPKGARRPQVRSLSPAAAVLSAIPLRAGEAMHVAAPLLHTWGDSALLIALLHGAPVVLNRRFTPEGFLRSVEEYRCGAVFAVPVMLQRVLELPAERLGAAWRAHRPRVVAVSGSALPGGLATAFMDRFGDVLYNLYGSTEVSWVSIATPADLRVSPGTAGRAPFGTRVLILDGDGR